MTEAAALTTDSWLPLAADASSPPETSELVWDLTEHLLYEGLERSDVLVDGADALVTTPAMELRRRLRESSDARPWRSHEVSQRRVARLDELDAMGMSHAGGTLKTARNGTLVPAMIAESRQLWRVIGLYLAEGHVARDGDRRRLQWSFHPEHEEHLVDEVRSFWESQGVKTTVRSTATARVVQVSSRVLCAWWTGELGLGRNCYTQRLPDDIWTRGVEARRALLEGLWEGDGSWSYVAGGPSVVLEWGTVSRELADGVLRLLGEFGIVARLKVGRTSKSTCDTYWVVISGADNVEQMVSLVRGDERELLRTSIDSQTKRIAPAGYAVGRDQPWVRVTHVDRIAHHGHVYSMEVPSTGTFVTTGGLVVHNCFPKDVAALKQLAGNSGYHFQLLNAVIEVNELQKRRLVGKLVKHLGPLRGKVITLLGLAFKPGTDDMREAASLVLSSRLLAEGAVVRGYDPVANEAAREHLSGVEICDDVMAAITGADAVVLVTEWPQFQELHLPTVAQAMRTPVLVDGRNMFSPQQVAQAGLTYEGVGRRGVLAHTPARRQSDRVEPAAAADAEGGVAQQ